MPTIYRITYTDPTGDNDGPLVVRSWHPSYAEARSARIGIMLETDLTRADIDIQPIDVPTRKTELIEFLNKHAR